MFHWRIIFLVVVGNRGRPGEREETWKTILCCANNGRMGTMEKVVTSENNWNLLYGLFQRWCKPISFLRSATILDWNEKGWLVWVSFFTCPATCDVKSDSPLNQWWVKIKAFSCFSTSFYYERSRALLWMVNNQIFEQVIIFFRKLNHVFNLEQKKIAT